MTTYCDWWTTGILSKRRELLLDPAGFIRVSCYTSGRPAYSKSSMNDPLEWCVLRWHLVVLCKDNHPYITTCLSSVNSQFSHLDHAEYNKPPPYERLSSYERSVTGLPMRGFAEVPGA